MSDAVQEALRKSYVAWNTGDVDLLDEVFAADVTYHLASSRTWTWRGSSKW